MVFPLSFDSFVNLELSAKRELTDSELKSLENNIELVRDAVIATTAFARAKGIGGHTGGPYDIVPEVLIVDALRDGGEAIHDEFFDEAGHRVATQYLLSALYGHLSPNQLRNYRVGHSCLPGHPELGLTPGVKFSSGRLGHMWPYVNI